jgi:hypothetical protein
LRYIDAVSLDYKEDIFTFLKEKLKITVDIDERLFEETKIRKLPLSFDLGFSFLSTRPNGALKLRFARGSKGGNGTDALIWETMVQSVAEDAPKAKEEIVTWVKEAHELTVYGWFFKMIEGELLRRFE